MSGSCSCPSARSSWRSSVAPKRAASGARGKIDDVADALEADAAERRHHVAVEPERGERQRRQALALRAAWLHLRLAEARRRPGGADRVGDGDAVREAGAAEAPREIAGQLRLAAEEMRAAADVEQQPVGRIDGDERRIAQASLGQVVEQMRFGGGIVRACHQIGMHGARLGERQSRRAGRAASAAASMATSRSALPCRAATTSGAPGGATMPSGKPCRSSRSVENRRSHRLRMR